MHDREWNRSIAIDEVRTRVWLYLRDNCRHEQQRVLVAAELLQMPEHEVRTFAQVHFSLSREVERLLDEMPRLARRLATTTRREVVHADGQIRGPLNWPETYALRAATGSPRTYATEPPERGFDTPENRLLAFVLGAIVEQGRRTGWHDDRRHRGRQAVVVGDRVKRATKWRELTQLTEARQTGLKRSDAARVRAGRSRQRYATVLKVWDLHRRYVQRLDREAVKEAVEQHALVDTRDEVLLELKCTFDTLDLLRDAGWMSEPERLLRTKHVFHGTRGDDFVDVYYQHTPSALADSSHYVGVQRAHGMRAWPLRPDLAIAHTREGAVRWTLVEVKSGASVGVRTLVRSTLRDLLMYRRTFSETLDGQEGLVAIGYAWGRGLEPRESHGIALCTPDTLARALGIAGLL